MTPGLLRRRSRSGRHFAFCVADCENVHVHGDSRMDLRLTQERIGEPRAGGGVDDRVRTGGPSAEWVAVRVGGSRDVALATDLVKQTVRANS